MSHEIDWLQMVSSLALSTWDDLKTSKMNGLDISDCMGYDLMNCIPVHCGYDQYLGRWFWAV